MSRPIVALAFLALLAAVLAGCRNTNDTGLGTTTLKTVHKSAPPPAPEPKPEPVGFPLEEVGTWTGQIAEATYFREHFKLGSLLYSQEGTPPQPVLDACPFLDSPPIIAASVYARGSIDFTYTKGTLPAAINVGFAEDPIEGDNYANGFLAFDVDGSWVCNSEIGPLGIEFQPGEKEHVPIWFIGYALLSNGQPEIPASVYNSWHFNFIGGYYGNSAEEPAIVGPGAGRCRGVKELFLFNRQGEC
jgi:predicted small secreted protein